MGLEPVLSIVFLCAFLLPCGYAVYVDLQERRIPNGCVALLALCGVAQLTLSWLMPSLAVLPWLPSPMERLFCAAAALAVGYGFELAWRRARGGAHGMGFGDIKLLAAVSLWLGPAILWVVFLSCLLALAVELPRGRRAFAFGPYIVAASAFCLLIPAFVV